MGFGCQTKRSINSFQMPEAVSRAVSCEECTWKAFLTISFLCVKLNVGLCSCQTGVQLN